LQRRILYRLLNPLPMHPSATGFVRGRSIVDNARPHVGSGVVINLDLADFFPTITTERVAAMFRGLGWDSDSATILSRICSDEGRLPQGAPTSPAISNLVCRRLDERLSGLVTSFKGHYTRYADDITLSLPGLGRNKRLRRHKGKQRPDRSNRPVRSPSRSLLTTIRQIIEEEGFQIQMKKKVRVQRPHQRQLEPASRVEYPIARLVSIHRAGAELPALSKGAILRSRVARRLLELPKASITTTHKHS
jgi:RNA-directed DNA polymerase